MLALKCLLQLSQCYYHSVHSNHWQKIESPRIHFYCYYYHINMNNENICTPTHLSQATTAIWMSANCDARNHALDVENGVVCGNAIEQNRSNAVE